MRVFMLSLLSVLALSGCRSLWDPTFMPAGYSYHQNNYKSPPGPEASDIGYEYTAAENEAVMEQWRHAVRDLLLKARTNDLQIPQEAFLQTDLKKNAFQGTFDSTLREELRIYGHRLVDSADGVPSVFYSAYDPAQTGPLQRSPDKRYNGDQEPDFQDSRFVPAAGNIQLVIGIIQDGQWLQKVSGVYELPLYGYKPGAYVAGYESPIKEQPSARQKMNTGMDER
ncbi:MAG: hypothetical protein IT559_08480 [Alphaproteobacteria bacterium]|nr:hypothetical protein [Alphaproteobacteria bacterium]